MEFDPKDLTLEVVHVKANPNLDLSGWKFEQKQATICYASEELYRMFTPWYERYWHTVRNWFRS